MSTQVLQINFKFGVPRSDYEQLAESLAPSFADVPGLLWKVWILNEENREAGGIYCFDSETSLDGFVSSQLAADVHMIEIDDTV